MNQIDSGRKSIGTLIDELITCDMKCWFAQERVMAGGEDQEVATAARLAQETNKRRNQLMRAIDAYFEDPNIQLQKSYDQDAPAALNPIEQSRLDLFTMMLENLALSVLHPTNTEQTRQIAVNAMKALGNHSYG